MPDLLDGKLAGGASGNSETAVERGLHINRVNNTLTMLAAQDGYVHQNIVAMCHAQTFYGVALASLGKEFEPIRARYSRENVSSEYIGWSHFQAIWNQLVETQTDMFD